MQKAHGSVKGGWWLVRMPSSVAEALSSDRLLHSTRTLGLLFSVVNASRICIPSPGMGRLPPRPRVCLRMENFQALLAGSRSTMEISGDLEPLASDAKPESNPT